MQMLKRSARRTGGGTEGKAEMYELRSFYDGQWHCHGLFLDLQAAKDAADEGYGCMTDVVVVVDCATQAIVYRA